MLIRTTASASRAAHHLIDRYLLLFQIAADLADVKRAEGTVYALLEVTPQRADALARLSSVHLTQHRFSAATEAAELAVRADSTSEAALAALFSVAMAAGHYGRAEAADRELDPQRLRGRIRIAQWLSATGEVTRALRNGVAGCRIRQPIPSYRHGARSRCAQRRSAGDVVSPVASDAGPEAAPLRAQALHRPELLEPHLRF